jgi:beta-D-xylosidase 4
MYDAGAPRLGIPSLNGLIETNSGVASSCYVDAGGASYCPTIFGAPLNLAASFNRSLWFAKGQVVGTELRAFMNLGVPRIYAPYALVGPFGYGPDINMILDPRNGRNGELPTEDPLLAGEYAAAYVQGCQSGPDPAYLKFAAFLKHYSFYQSETDRFAFDGNVTGFDAWDTYLPPFQAGFLAGNASGAMCSYSSFNGVPSCASPYLQTAVLREYWNRTDSFIASDCFAIENQVTQNHFAANYSQASAASLLAGTDACDGFGYTADGGLQTALSSGALSVGALNTALSRSLRLRFATGMFDPPAQQLYCTYGPEMIGSPDALAVRTEVAQQGLVLLQNSAQGLPLRAAALGTVAVVGPHAISTGDLLGDYYEDAYCPGPTTPSSRADACVPSIGASVAQFLAATNPAAGVLVEQGVGIVSTNASGVPAALAAVQLADVVVACVGFSNALVEHEGADHNYTTLPGIQAAFLQQVYAAAAKTGAPVVVVLVNAGPIALDGLIQPAAAIVEAFYPSFGAPQIVQQLFGQLNRWGRLPYTIYDAAYPDSIPLQSLAVAAAPGRTYRYYAGAPLWTFGDGLSYAAFDTSCALPANATVAASQPFNLSLPCSTRATASVASPGVAADHVLLLFHRVGADVVARIAGAHPIPAKTLVDFQRVGPLAVAGPAGAAPFFLQPQDLALTDQNGASVLYPGTHYIDVSPQAPAPTITLTITVSGANPVVLAQPPPFPKPQPE